MLVSGLWVIFSWVIAVLLLANSFTILINIFDFPPTAMRHLVSFEAAAGALVGILFIIMGVMRYLDFPKRR
jgi:hypothetical protein